MIKKTLFQIILVILIQCAIVRAIEPQDNEADAKKAYENAYTHILDED